MAHSEVRSVLCCCSILSLFHFLGIEGTQIEAAHRADTHTRWRLAAQRGSAVAEGLRRVLRLSAQLGNSGEMRTVPVVPNIQGNLYEHGLIFQLSRDVNVLLQTSQKRRGMLPVFFYNKHHNFVLTTTLQWASWIFKMTDKRDEEGDDGEGEIESQRVLLYLFLKTSKCSLGFSWTILQTDPDVRVKEYMMKAEWLG